MDIYHRITFNPSTIPDLFKVTRDLGLKIKIMELPGGVEKIVFLDIMESDQYWQNISKLIKPDLVLDRMDTIFLSEEVRKAEWSRLISTFEQGYPQPKLNWPIKQVSYDIFCPKCAIHKQIGPMRIAKEPSLGKKSFMTLIWSNEIFCKPEVLEALEAINVNGYEVWNVLIHKTGLPAEKIKQIHIPNIADPGLIIDNDLQQNVCPVCGTIKYDPHIKGVMRIKKGAINPNVDFILTNEWFGSGFIAYREILVSNRVANLILDKGFLGVRFKVVEVI